MTRTTGTKANQKKVAIISGTFPPMRCGVGDYTAMLSQHLAGQAVTVSVLTSTAAQALPGPVEVLPMVPQWRWGSIKLIIDQLRILSPDIVLMQWPTAAYGRSLAINYLPRAIKNNFPELPLVATLHELRYFKPWTRLRLHWLYQAASQLILVDPQDRAYVPDPLTWTLPMATIPIGSSIPVAPARDRSRYRRQWGLAPQEKVIVFFGMANAPKGLLALVDSLAGLTYLPFKLLLVTELKPEQPYQKKVLNRLEQTRLVERTIIVSNRPAREVAGLLASADMAVLPFEDGVSLKRSSLMACLQQGLPVITTEPWEEEQRQSWFRHEVNMLLVPPHDRQVLNSAIERLIHDRPLGQKLSQGAKALAGQFVWETIAKQHIRIFKKLW